MKLSDIIVCFFKTLVVTDIGLFASGRLSISLNILFIIFAMVVGRFF